MLNPALKGTARLILTGGSSRIKNVSELSMVDVEPLQTYFYLDINAKEIV